MTTPNLSRLLRPKSIAIFGGGWAANVVEQLLKAGFEGDIWPVHPTRADVHGVKAYPSLDALPAAPDAAWIGVNRDATIDIVRALRDMGAGGVVCFASGFRETTDGADRNTALLDAAADMPIIGPNCYGALNYLDGATLWPDQHGGARLGAQSGKVDAGFPSDCATKRGGIAILTQSSNIAINMTMQRRGLPIAYVMTAGNQAQIGLAEMAEALLEDERITAIGLHVEGVGDPAAFESLAAKARAKRIPIIAIKVGASEQAQTATVSHTASLAGSEAGSKAFFKRIGVPLLHGIPAFMETLKLLHVHGPLPGRDILSMSCSGGEASLMADTAMAYDLRFRPYAEAEKTAIAATLNPMVTVANPLDYHTFIWGDQPAMTATFAAAMAPGFDLSMLILDFPREDRCSHKTWEPAVAAIIAAAQQVSARAAVVASLAELLPEDRCDQFTAAGVAPLCGMEEALIAADAAAQIGEAWTQPPSLPLSRATTRDLAPLRTDLWSETASKHALEQHGLSIPFAEEAHDPTAAEEAAERAGYPVAVKAVGVAHKTEIGGVILNLTTRQHVNAAAAQIMRQCDSVLVEKMIEGGLVEMILGITRDPVYGPMLTIGAGGIFTELLSDSATLLLPITETDLREAIASLRVSKILAGWRGKPAADIDALIDAALAVSRFAEAHSDMLIELDINPLIVCEKGAFAADALIRMRE